MQKRLTKRNFILCLFLSILHMSLAKPQDSAPVKEHGFVTGLNTIQEAENAAEAFTGVGHLLSGLFTGLIGLPAAASNAILKGIQPMTPKPVTMSPGTPAPPFVYYVPIRNQPTLNATAGIGLNNSTGIFPPALIPHGIQYNPQGIQYNPQGIQYAYNPFIFTQPTAPTTKIIQTTTIPPPDNEEDDGDEEDDD